MTTLPFLARFLIFAVGIAVALVLILVGCLFMVVVGLGMIFGVLPEWGEEGAALIAFPAVAVITLLVIIAAAIVANAMVASRPPSSFWLGLLLVIAIVVLAGAAAALTAMGAVLAAAGLSVVFLGLLCAAVVSLVLVWFVFAYHRIPLDLLGVAGLTSLPAVPFRLAEFFDTIPRLLDKQSQVAAAKAGLSTVVALRSGTPSVRTADGFTLLYGSDEDQANSLDAPDQFSLGWNSIGSVNRNAAPLLSKWAASLDTAQAATDQFWETISKYTAVFGIMPLEKLLGSPRGVTSFPARTAALRSLMGIAWTAEMDDLATQGNLFVIDLVSIFATLPSPPVDRRNFTPATITFLRMVRSPDPADTFPVPRPRLVPFLIRVSNGTTTHDYTFTSGSTNAASNLVWLYAIQAAKASLMTWSIWLGHVYRTHIVTTAMQMTMFQYLPPEHPVRQLFGYQSDFVIGFDQFLLMDWSIGPPTSVASPDQLLTLFDTFAQGRAFFDDDPTIAIAAQGLAARDSVSLGSIPLSNLFRTLPLTTAPATPGLSALTVTTVGAGAGIVADFTTPEFFASDIINLATFVPRLTALLARRFPLSLQARGLLDSFSPTALAGFTTSPNAALTAALVASLNTLVKGPRLDTLPDTVFWMPPLAAAALRAAFTPGGPEDPFINRRILEETFGVAPAPPAPTVPPALPAIPLPTVTPADLEVMDFNLYPSARYLLKLFSATADYVTSVVTAMYPGGNAQVASDVPLQAWLAASSDPQQGNVSGLPTVTTVAGLVSVLTSLIYRITSHGIGRMAQVADPAISFVANFPPCLEDSRLPDPSTATPMTTPELLAFLPKTGTIGEMIAFAYGFAYAKPYVPFIPEAGVGADLPYTGPTSAACNAALVAYRAQLAALIAFFASDSNVQNGSATMNFQVTPAQLHQWELCIET